jgi:hypothetical protein
VLFIDVVGYAKIADDIQTDLLGRQKAANPEVIHFEAQTGQVPDSLGRRLPIMMIIGAGSAP